MPTKNPRINVTFEKKTANLLTKLAENEHKPVSSIVRDLALEALELREDLYLSNIAEHLDKEGAITHSHDDAWK